MRENGYIRQTPPYLCSPTVCVHACMRACMCAHVHTQQHLTPCNTWTVAHQAPLFRGLPRQEYGSRLPFPRDLTHPGTELCLLHWQKDSLSLTHLGSPCYPRIQPKLCFLLRLIGNLLLGNFIGKLSLIYPVAAVNQCSHSGALLPPLSQSYQGIFGSI